MKRYNVFALANSRRAHAYCIRDYIQGNEFRKPAYRQRLNKFLLSKFFSRLFRKIARHMVDGYTVILHAGAGFVLEAKVLGVPREEVPPLRGYINLLPHIPVIDLIRNNHIIYIPYVLLKTSYTFYHPVIVHRDLFLEMQRKAAEDKSLYERKQ